MRIKYTELKLRQEFRDELQDWNDIRSDFIGRYTDESCNPHREAMLNAHRVMSLAAEHMQRCVAECNDPIPAGRTWDAIETEISEFINDRDHIPGVEFQRDPRGRTVLVFFNSRMQGRKPGESDSDAFDAPNLPKPDWIRDFKEFIGTEYEANA